MTGFVHIETIWLDSCRLRRVPKPSQADGAGSPLANCFPDQGLTDLGGKDLLRDWGDFVDRTQRGC